MLLLLLLPAVTHLSGWWHDRHSNAGHWWECLQVLQHLGLDALQLSTRVAVLHVADLHTQHTTAALVV
jgi:hypothetical protein